MRVVSDACFVKENNSTFGNFLLNVKPDAVGFAVLAISHEDSFVALECEFYLEFIRNKHVGICTKDSHMRFRGIECCARL